MQDFINRKILLGISGGIAAYKSAHLVRELTRLGAEVRVVMTASAQQFITPMTMQALSGADVRCELFDSNAERAMGHIELARWADYLVVAPASANCLAKMAHGLADDLLSTLYLVAEIPVFVCPAMNKSMWAHPATQHNCEQLMHRGVIFIEPETGAQACGEYGVGRMSEIHHIIAALRLYEVRHLLAGHHVLITAGTTHELIDPVRFISNKSSGKMGYALAQAAYMAGAYVTLVSGPSALTPPEGVHFLRVTTAREMFDTVMSCLKPGMIFMGTAAVADYAVAEPKTQKLKKHGQDTLTLTLTPNPDILATVASRRECLFVAGFAAETQDVVANARQKLVAKKLDMIVANQVGEGLGFDVDENQVTVITSNSQIELNKNNKTRLAGQLIAIIAGSLQNEPQ
jgi:phosphopantothenoylcysteine decarboxylase / phosphopantothenate---cysteine ligase